MRLPSHHGPVAACALAAVLLLVGCGGGSASAPGTVSGSSGFVVDDYVRGATVLCDSNGNGIADSGEATTQTDSSGFFRFSPSCGSSMVVTGGTNVDTGLPFIGMLRAPAGATVVTPLTTLVSSGMTVDQVNTALGLPAGTDLLNTDPARKLAGTLVNSALMKKTLAMQQVLQKTTEILAGLAGSGGDAARAAIYREVAAAAAVSLPGGTALGSGSTLDAAVVANLVKAATQRIAASTTLAADVKAGAQGVNADSLAQVVAGAIKAQADAILAASDTGITAATLAAQSDSQITTFVVTNRTQLAAAPSGDSQTLAGTLTNQVIASQTGGGGGGGTPPTSSGTVLVSFDEANPAFMNMGAYGGAQPTVEAGPTGGSGNALRILKPASPDTWGGVFFNVAAIPFTADRKTITARVNATRAGAVIRLKVEVSQNDFVEIPSSPTGPANTWQTVTWNLAGVDPAKSYTLMAITPDVDRVTDGQSYYIDDITLAPAAPVVVTPPTTAAFITFDEANPAFMNMGAYGGAQPTVEAGPTGGSGNALRILKPVSPNTWGGVFFNVAPIPFTAERKTITARVNATRAGAVIMLKVEVSQNDFVEVASAPTGPANTWQTVTWNLAGVNPAKSYTLIAITPDVDRVTDGQSYYIDDITLAPAAPVVVTPPTTAAFITFDEANPPFTNMGAYGGAQPTVEAGPSGGSGNALRILKPVSPNTWGGVFFNVAPIPFTADRKTITARVNATRAGAVIMLKVEVSQNDFVEVASAPTGPANTWQTVTWNLAGVNPAKSYTLMAITPDVDRVTDGQSYYIDDITLAPAAGGGGGGGGTPVVFDPNAAMGSNGPQAITIASADIRTPNGGLTFFSAGEAIFAADYLGSAEAFAPFNLAAYPSARTVSYPGVGNAANGNIGYYQDDATLSASANKIEEGGYVVGSVLDANGAPNFFRYFIMKGPAIPNSYMGLFVNAPNNGTVNISAFSRIKFRLWGPRSMYELSFHPQGLELILAGPKVAGCNTGSGGTEIVQTFSATQTIGAASQYKLPLSGFTVKGVCAGDTNATAVASVLANLARVVVNVPGTAFNFTIAEPNTNPALYAIGLNLGAIGFTNIP